MSRHISSSSGITNVTSDYYSLTRRMSCTFAKVTTRFRRILMAFHERNKSSTLPTSNVVDEVNTLMTKIGAIFTAIFVLSMSYTCIHYYLHRSGLVDYIINSPVQKIGVLLAACNAVVNPFVYVLLMPTFRDSFRKTFHLPSLRCDAVSTCRFAEDSRAVGTRADTVPGGAGMVTRGTVVRETPGTLQQYKSIYWQPRRLDCHIHNTQNNTGIK